MVFEEAQLTLDLVSLALGAHCLLILRPCLLHEAPLAHDLALAYSRGLVTHGLHSGPIGSLFKIVE